MATLDELAARQTQLGKEIEKLSNSYYADSPDKKTINYLKDKVAKLQKAWSDFEDNDTYIRDNFAWNLDHDYYTKEYYDKVKKAYDTVVPEILNLIKVVENRQSGNGDKNGKPTADTSAANAGSAQDELKKMIKNEERLLTTLDKILNNIIANTDIQSHQYYAIKNEIIKKYWRDVEEINKSIWESTEDKAAFGYNEQRFFDVQEKYQTVLVKFANEQNACRNIEDTSAVQEFSPMMRLPKIELPKFDGSYLKWQQFYDLFSQMVHNRPLSNAQKMFYLKANLVGEAERLIRHIPVSDDNYFSAWETLKKRYANKRL